MVNSDWIHFLATGIWGLYGIVVGSLVIVHGYSGLWPFVSVIAAIVGNSAHLVTFAYSRGKITMSSQKVN